MIREEKLRELMKKFEGKNIEECITIIKKDKDLSLKDKIRMGVEIGVMLGVKKGKELAAQEALEKIKSEFAEPKTKEETENENATVPQ